MSKKGVKKTVSEKPSTLAAGSLAWYFQNKRWKIVSFFPNCACKDKDFPGTGNQ